MTRGTKQANPRPSSYEHAGTTSGAERLTSGPRSSRTTATPHSARHPPTDPSAITTRHWDPIPAHHASHRMAGRNPCNPTRTGHPPRPTRLTLTSPREPGLLQQIDRISQLRRPINVWSRDGSVLPSASSGLLLDRWSPLPRRRKGPRRHRRSKSFEF